MSASMEEIKQGIIDSLHESMKIDFSPEITEKNLKREGINGETLQDSQAEFIQNALGDMFLRQDMNLPASSNFFPIQLDPNVYDQKSLFLRTPVLTYLEGRGRKFPANTTKFNYIELTEGFQEEWIGETDGTESTGSGATDLGTAQICFEAVPFNLSDLLGAGQTVASRAQIMGFIQETLREGYEKVLLNGTAGTTQNPTNQFPGLFTIADANGVSKDKSGNAVTLNDMRYLNADLRQRQKGLATFVVTDDYSHVSIQEEMSATIRNVNTVDNIIAGVNPTAFQAGADKIPILPSPFSPMTLGEDVTEIPTGRSLGMFNEQFINIHDLITPSWVEAGKTKPLSTNGWVVTASVMFYNVPPKTAMLKNIAG